MVFLLEIFEFSLVFSMAIISCFSFVALWCLDPIVGCVGVSVSSKFIPFLWK